MSVSRRVWGLLGSAIIFSGTNIATAQDLPESSILFAQSKSETEADSLLLEGWSLFEQGTVEGYRAAISKLQTALSLYSQQQHDEKIALTNLALGVVHSDSGYKQEALTYYENSLAVYQKIGDLNGEANTIGRISSVYSDLGERQKALDFYQQVLLLRQTVGDRAGEATTLGHIGLIHSDLGEKQKALDFYQQALLLSRAVSDRAGEATILSNIGLVYDDLGEKQKALDFYQQALLLSRAVSDRAGEATTLSNIGLVYDALGEKQKALDFYQQALPLSRAAGDYTQEAITLNNIGAVYSGLGQTEKALDFYLQSLKIDQASGNRSGEANTLSNIGVLLSDDLRQEQLALDFYQQALLLRQAVGDRAGEAVTLNNIGLVYDALGEKQQALDYFQQALPLRRAVGDRHGEAVTLNNVAAVFSDLEQSELSVIFYKQSVNAYETLRDDIKGLDQDIQKTYLSSIEYTYRNLADALLEQDRILEAQRVLDLLKVQELDDYLNNVRGNDDTETGIVNRTAESIIINGYNILLDDAIQVGQTLTELSQIPVGERTSEQRDQIRSLRQAREEITVEISEFFESEPVQAELAKLQRNTDGESIDLDLYAKNLRDELTQLDNAVILYPLVLGDRLELIVISATAPPFRRTVPLSRVELNQAILDYRNALTRPQLRRNLDAVQAASNTLYDALIAPLAADLENLGTENIIYAPDGQLRYVPLSALYDGNQWLIENYNINNITAVSLTNFTDKPSGELAVLAGAFTDTESTVTVGDRNFPFDDLPHAQPEVEAIAQTISATTTRLGKDFNADIRFEVEDYNVVHLATHAKFVSGTPEESFILFNNQEKQTLKDVEKWDLTNVDLLVLSACQTALGDELGDGKEILGLGFQMQRAGAKSTIASLWSVDDGGTQVLMNNFYAVLANEPNITKAEALRKAQVALAQNIDPVTGEPTENSLGRNLNHPYYWSPFILIGNGL